MKRDLQIDLEICEKATPGPWRHIGLRVYVDGKRPYIENEIGIAHILANSRLIASAREGWPEAIRRAIAAEAEVKRLYRLLQENVAHCSNTNCEYLDDTHGTCSKEVIYHDGEGKCISELLIYAD